MVWMVWVWIGSFTSHVQRWSLFVRSTVLNPFGFRRKILGTKWQANKSMKFLEFHRSTAYFLEGEKSATSSESLGKVWQASKMHVEWEMSQSRGIVPVNMNFPSIELFSVTLKRLLKFQG